MDEKTKELVAIGASVCAHCQPCVNYHVAKARALGLGEELIREAVAVGRMVEKGSGVAMRDYVEKVLGGGEPPERPSECCGGSVSKKGCCC